MLPLCEDVLDHGSEVGNKVQEHTVDFAIGCVQQGTVEQCFDVSAPEIVEEIVDVVQITPQEHFRQCTLEQVAFSLVRSPRLCGCAPQELLLSSVALDRSQASAVSLDQRIAEHERRIQEDRLPEQVAEQIQDAPAKTRKKRQTQK